MAGDGKMGVQLDVPSDGYAGRLEVLEGPTGRRRWSEAERRGSLRRACCRGCGWRRWRAGTG